MLGKVKLKVGKYRIQCNITEEGNRLLIRAPYHKGLIEEIKAMQGPKWHGFDDIPRKIWSIANTPRNHFQLQYLMEQNPYSRFEQSLPELDFERPVYEHQKEMTAHGLIRKCCIFACEMGTGKTLAAIEIMERVISDEILGTWNLCWYIGPKSGVRAVKRELRKWKCKVVPEMFTYEQLVKVMKNWENWKEIPQILIIDESSKVKTPLAQRSQAVLHLANAVRESWKDKAYIILMSGTPAPKSPVDWWHQCEIACPGFLKEGNIHKFKKRLAIIEERESITGGVYPHLVTWLDDENKCAKCGKFKDEHDILDPNYHPWEKSINEVQYLYKRMKGLVLVKFKKDCLDLPDKQYRIIYVKPKEEVLRLAKLIANTSRRTIEALMLLRELSDGFQYQEIQTEDRIECKVCHGTGNTKIPEPMTCLNCEGNGWVFRTDRIAEYVGTPKDKVFIELLDDHEDYGRFIVWGGFTATIDHLVQVAHRYGWATLRVDGRGYKGQAATGEPIDTDILLDAMDYSHPNHNDLLFKYPKLCFVGHPQAGGMALTLTASPTELFYSNSFDGTARPQAEDRFHRAGMDTNRAATIIDLIHLKTDQLVLDNLKQKKRLQDLSLGQVAEALE